MTDRAPPADRLRQAIQRIAELDEEMLRLDETLVRYEMALADPDADGWDRIDAEGKMAPLLEKRNLLCRDLMLTIGDATSAGYVLINGWRENEIDNVGKELIQGDGVLARVLDEFPGTAWSVVWQRLNAAGCPF